MQSRSPIASIHADTTTLTLRLRRDQPMPRHILGRALGASSWETLTFDERDRQTITLPRFDSQQQDRAFFQFLPKTANNEPLGEPQWVTAFDGVRASPIPWPKSIKGVQCVVDIDDAIALGAKHVGLNCAIREILQPSLGPWGGPVELIQVDSEKIALSPGALQRYDEQVLRFTQAGINVTLILLNTLGKGARLDDLIHPKTDRDHLPNGIGAFNLTSERGARLYRAVLTALAQRYTDPANRHGRVSGMIIGNEVQSHWEWYNIGEAEPEAFVKDYALALRAAWLAVKSVHQDLRVYVSMDYHWEAAHATEERSLPGRFLIDRLTALSREQGDYDWNIAQHPYPQGLFDPIFWDDDEAGMGFNTPIITFRNIEVLMAYLKRTPTRGPKGARRVILSEQGFNCKGEGERAEAIQAAAYAYAYRKVSQLPGIDAFILHRHQDHPQEGGLKLGLRDLQGRRRPMWTVCQKADTPEWESAFAFALPLCGLKSWKEAAPFGEKIGEKSGIALRTRYPGTVLFDFVGKLSRAKRDNALDFRTTRATNSKGERVYGLFLHPKAAGPADATFTVALPRVQKLTLRFESLNSAMQAAPNGIRFAVLIEGTEVWTTTHADFNKPRTATIDLSAHAGKTIRLTFRTDAQGKEAHCWATFLSPAIVKEKVE